MNERIRVRYLKGGFVTEYRRQIAERLIRKGLVEEVSREISPPVGAGELPVADPVVSEPERETGGRRGSGPRSRP
jgi:hypothetical protein